MVHFGCFVSVSQSLGRLGPVPLHMANEPHDYPRLINRVSNMRFWVVRTANMSIAAF